jgi:hypothetical protein
MFDPVALLVCVLSAALTALLTVLCQRAVRQTVAPVVLDEILPPFLREGEARSGPESCVHGSLSRAVHLASVLVVTPLLVSLLSAALSPVAYVQPCDDPSATVWGWMGQHLFGASDQLDTMHWAVLPNGVGAPVNSLSTTQFVSGMLGSPVSSDLSLVEAAIAQRGCGEGSEVSCECGYQHMNLTRLFPALASSAMAPSMSLRALASESPSNSTDVTSEGEASLDEDAELSSQLVLGAMTPCVSLWGIEELEARLRRGELDCRVSLPPFSSDADWASCVLRHAASGGPMPPAQLCADFHQSVVQALNAHHTGQGAFYDMSWRKVMLREKGQRAMLVRRAASLALLGIEQRGAEQPKGGGLPLIKEAARVGAALDRLVPRLRKLRQSAAMSQDAALLFKALPASLRGVAGELIGVPNGLSVGALWSVLSLVIGVVCVGGATVCGFRYWKSHTAFVRESVDGEIRAWEHEVEVVRAAKASAQWGGLALGGVGLAIGYWGWATLGELHPLRLAVSAVPPLVLFVSASLCCRATSLGCACARRSGRPHFVTVLAATAVTASLSVVTLFVTAASHSCMWFHWVSALTYSATLQPTTVVALGLSTTLLLSFLDDCIGARLFEGDELQADEAPGHPRHSVRLKHTAMVRLHQSQPTCCPTHVCINGARWRLVAVLSDCIRVVRGWANVPVTSMDGISDVTRFLHALTSSWALSWVTVWAMRGGELLRRWLLIQTSLAASSALGVVVANLVEALVVCALALALCSVLALLWRLNSLREMFFRDVRVDGREGLGLLFFQQQHQLSNGFRAMVCRLLLSAGLILPHSTPAEDPEPPEPATPRSRDEGDPSVPRSTPRPVRTVTSLEKKLRVADTVRSAMEDEVMASSTARATLAQANKTLGANVVFSAHESREPSAAAQSSVPWSRGDVELWLLVLLQVFGLSQFMEEGSLMLRPHELLPVWLANEASNVQLFSGMPAEASIDYAVFFVHDLLVMLNQLREKPSIQCLATMMLQFQQGAEASLAGAFVTVDVAPPAVVWGGCPAPAWCRRWRRVAHARVHELRMRPRGAGVVDVVAKPFRLNDTRLFSRSRFRRAVLLEAKVEDIYAREMLGELHHRLMGALSLFDWFSEGDHREADLGRFGEHHVEAAPASRFQVDLDQRVVRLSTDVTNEGDAWAVRMARPLSVRLARVLRSAEGLVDQSPESLLLEQQYWDMPPTSGVSLPSSFGQDIDRDMALTAVQEHLEALRFEGMSFEDPNDMLDVTLGDLFRQSLGMELPAEESGESVSSWHNRAFDAAYRGAVVQAATLSIPSGIAWLEGALSVLQTWWVLWVRSFVLECCGRPGSDSFLVRASRIAKLRVHQLWLWCRHVASLSPLGGAPLAGEWQAATEEERGLFQNGRERLFSNALGAQLSENVCFSLVVPCPAEERSEVQTWRSFLPEWFLPEGALRIDLLTYQEGEFDGVLTWLLPSMDELLSGFRESLLRLEASRRLAVGKDVLRFSRRLQASMSDATVVQLPKQIPRFRTETARIIHNVLQWGRNRLSRSLGPGPGSMALPGLWAAISARELHTLRGVHIAEELPKSLTSQFADWVGAGPWSLLQPPPPMLAAFVRLYMAEETFHRQGEDPLPPATVRPAEEDAAGDAVVVRPAEADGDVVGVLWGDVSLVVSESVRGLLPETLESSDIVQWTRMHQLSSLVLLELLLRDVDADIGSVSPLFSSTESTDRVIIPDVVEERLVRFAREHLGLSPTGPDPASQVAMALLSGTARLPSLQPLVDGLDSASDELRGRCGRMVHAVALRSDSLTLLPQLMWRSLAIVATLPLLSPEARMGLRTELEGCVDSTLRHVLSWIVNR